ncbi:MAG: hypothetical protein ACRCXD_10150, partial [Luteolibacter sp.]
VEDGLASKTLAAYIDLNPVRAGIVSDPADYRWSSYGEAMGATGKSGAKAKAGLVRAIMAGKGWDADARHWPGKISREYRLLLCAEGKEVTRETVDPRGGRVTRLVRKGMKPQQVKSGTQPLAAGREVALHKMLRWKVRYFADGAVIGSRTFVDDYFAQCRDRFGPQRKTGARKLRGNAAGAAGVLWSLRDLRADV